MIASILLFSFGGPEFLVIALIVLLIFGGKKIPELMRGLGKGVSEFKKGMNDITDSVKEDEKKEEDKKENEGK